jgi:hypothetical protein
MMMTREHIDRVRGNGNGSLILSSGDKGGVGKSFILRVAAHNLDRWGLAWRGFDGDARNSHLVRFYGDGSHVQPLVLKTDADFDRLLDQIEQTDLTDHILIDAPAGAGDIIERRGQRLLDLTTLLGRPLVRLFAIDEEDDVLMAIHREKHVLGLHNIVAVLNGRFGRRENFELWDRPVADGAGSTRDQVLAAGGAEIYLPALPPAPRVAIRNARCRFADALDRLTDLSFSQRANLTDWIAEMEEAFLPLRRRLEGGAK